jgi:hypothetical protein
MLPIEPVFEEISMKYSPNQHLKVDVPGAVALESLRPKAQMHTSTMANPRHTPVERSSPHPIPGVMTLMNRIEGQLSLSSPAPTFVQEEEINLRRSRMVWTEEYGASQSNPPPSYDMGRERGEPQTPGTPNFILFPSCFCCECLCFHGEQ